MNAGEDGDGPAVSPGEYTRRQLLRLSMLCAGTAPWWDETMGVGTAIRSQESELLDEGFESYDEGGYPDTWVKNGNEDQEVVSDHADEGSKSLRLSGSFGGCWEAIANAPISLPDGGFELNGSIKPTDSGEEGCHNSRGKLVLATSNTSWDAGQRLGILSFRTDGTVTGINGGELGKYEVDTWTAFEIELRRTGNRFELTYHLNGEERGQTSLATPEYASNISHLRLSSGDTTVYYDRLRAVSISPSDEDSSTEITGEVTDRDDTPVAGATVRLPLADEELSTKTNTDGRFAFDLSDRNVPSTVTVLVDAEGYLTGSVNVATDSDATVDIVLTSSSARTVQITDEIHHLGDGSFGGTINSQFQESVEGEELSEEFDLATPQAEADTAELVYTIRGAQEDNTIYINGTDVGEADHSNEDGSASERRLEFDTDVLESGTNTLRVISATNPDNIDDIDDFEISNIRLVLEGIQLNLGLQIRDARCVQTVENTRLNLSSTQGIDREFDSPDLVEGRGTTVLFGVTGEDLDVVETTARVRFTYHYSNVSDKSDTREVPTRVLWNATVSNEASTIVRGVIRANPREGQDPEGNRGYPVFEGRSDIDQVEVSVGLPAYDVESTVTLEPTFVEMPPFKLGIVGIENPQANYGEFGIFRGEDAYEARVIDFAEYIQRVYPTDRVVVYYHSPDETIVGSTNTSSSRVPGNVTVGEYADGFEARTTLEEQLPVSPGDASNGTVTVVEDGRVVDSPEEYDVTIRESIGGFGGFDATLAIVPDGYFDYHNHSASGVHFGAPSAAGTTQGPLTPLAEATGREWVGAHEVGHHLLGSLYSGNLAQIDDNGSLDHAHANQNALLSRKVATENSAMYTFDIVDDAPAYMSYANSDRWADSVAYQHMIDESFSPTPREVGEFVAESVDDAVEGTQRLLNVIAEKTTDGIEIIRAHFGPGMDTTVDDGDVTVQARDQSGETIQTTSLPSGFRATAQEGSTEEQDLIVGGVRVPAETTEIAVQTTTEDGQTLQESFVPASRSLIDLVQTLPESAFESDASNVGQEVVEMIRTAGTAIEENRYETAVASLVDARESLDEALRPGYEPAPNQPSADEVDRRLAERIQWVRDRQAEADTDTQTPASTTQTQTTETATSTPATETQTPPPTTKQGDNANDDSLPLWLPALGGLGGLGGLLAGLRYLQSDADSQRREDLSGNVTWSNDRGRDDMRASGAENQQYGYAGSNGRNHNRPNRAVDSNRTPQQPRHGGPSERGDSRSRNDQEYETNEWDRQNQNRRQHSEDSSFQDQPHENNQQHGNEHYPENNQQRPFDSQYRDNDEE